MLALGFSSGLPFLLVFSTQSAWLREAGVSRTEIGLLSYVALAYSFKFLWAPLIDRIDVPGLRFLGRRRAWMLVAQASVMLGLVALAFGDPSDGLAWTVAAAFFVAFASATQDVVVDGWRIDAATPERQGMMSAAYQLGYRLALLCAGAGALYIADAAGWKAAYMVMALLMTIGIVACLLAPGGSKQETAPNTPHANFSIRALGKIYAGPVADLVRRKSVLLVPILILVALYRLPDFVSGVMANPLYIDLGFSKSDIATVSKVYGVWVGIAGAFAGGVVVLRLGLMPALFLGGIAASASHLSLAWLASSGARLDILTVAISVENFASGFAGTALISYMSSLTSPEFAAAQYALLSSLYALPGKLVGGLSGLMADSFGYPVFFVMTSTIGIPVALLCLAVWRASRVRQVPDHAGLLV
jgi:PAT family beta-lactamase induction signal transducer AmpG